MNADTEKTIRETDIRPDHLMKRSFELLEEDARHLMKDQASFVKVPCPACSSSNASHFCEKRGMNFDICPSCQTVFGNPRPSQKRLDQYYREAEYYNYWNEFIYPQSEKARRKQIISPRIKHIKNACRTYRLEPKTLVEVGAGFGTFCEEMNKHDFFEEVIAIEPTPASAESCRQHGVEVWEKTVEKVDFKDQTISIVVSFEVLEHLFNPAAFIENCTKILSPGGLLVLTCPNIQGFDLSVLKEAADTITPEHLNLFNPFSISYLVNSIGLSVLEVSTPGRLDAEIVRKKALEGKVDLTACPFLQKILIDQWDAFGKDFQDYLAQNRQSSHMWMIARKPQNSLIK